MGVRGLWQLLLPIGRRVSIETLEGKVLAVDASIWMTQFLKAMRDPETGKVCQSAHLLGFARRIVKLLYHGIRPVFVFDGKTPMIKLREIRSRRERREGLLRGCDEDGDGHMKRLAKRILVAELRRKKEKERIGDGKSVGVDATAASGRILLRREKEDETDVSATSSFAPGFYMGVNERHETAEDKSLHDEVEDAIVLVQESECQAVKKSMNDSTQGLNRSPHGGKYVCSADQVSELDSGQVLAPKENKEEDDNKMNESSSTGSVFDDEDDDDDDNTDEEYSDGQHSINLRDSDDEVDLEVAASLPGNLKKDAFEKAKKKQRLQSRKEFMPVAANPHAYSQVQLKNFLRSSRLNKKITELSCKGSSNGGSTMEEGERVASDATRRIIFTKNDSLRNQVDKFVLPETVAINESYQERRRMRRRKRAPAQKDETALFLSPPRMGAASPRTAARQFSDRSSDGEGPINEQASKDRDDVMVEDGNGFIPQLYSLGKSEENVNDAKFHRPFDRRKETDITGRGFMTTWYSHSCATDDNEGKDQHFDERLYNSISQIDADEALARQLQAEENDMADGGRDGTGAIHQLQRNGCFNDGECTSSEKHGRDAGNYQVKGHSFSSESDEDSEVDWEDGDNRQTESCHQCQPKFHKTNIETEPKSACLSDEQSCSQNSALRPRKKTSGDDDLDLEGGERTLDDCPHSEKTCKLGDKNRHSTSHAHVTEPGRKECMLYEPNSESEIDWEEGNDGVMVKSSSALHGKSDEPGIRRLFEFKSACVREQQKEGQNCSPQDEMGSDSNDSDIDWEEGENVDRDSMAQSHSVEKVCHGESKLPSEGLDSVDTERSHLFENDLESITRDPVGDNRKLSMSGSSLAKISSTSNSSSSNNGMFDFGSRGKERNFATIDSSDATVAALEHAAATASNLTNWAGRAFRRAVTAHLEDTKSSLPDKVCGQSEIKSTIPRKEGDCGEGVSDVTNRKHATKGQRHVSTFTPRTVNDDMVDVKGGQDLKPPSRLFNEGEISAEKLVAEEDILIKEMHRQQRDMDAITDDMKEEVMQLLEMFGIPYVRAPAEAEAQCATLEDLGLVNGVVTEDSDCFVFGGKTVYKNIFDERKYVEVYLAKDAERELSLSRNHMIALAMLLGGDYTDGVKGVGIVNGMEIMHGFPSIGSDVKNGLIRFRKWLDGFDPAEEIATKVGKPTVRGILELREQMFHKKHRSARTRWVAPKDFPAPDVLQAYSRPVVDKSRARFSWGFPDIDLIKVFFHRKMGWSQEETDALVLPAVKKLESGSRQTRLDSFFMTYTDHVKFAQVRSERLRNVMFDLKSSMDEKNIAGKPETVVDRGRISYTGTRSGKKSEPAAGASEAMPRKRKATQSEKKRAVRLK